MFSLRSLCAALALLSLRQLATAQTVVNSTFLNRHPEPAIYSDPNNWAPAEVPNNTSAKQYNVDIGRVVDVDVDATILNLRLGGAYTGLNIVEKTFTINGATTNEIQSGSITIQSSAAAAARFNAGTLSRFANNGLSGNYYIQSDGMPATLQFQGANITTLTDGYFSLSGPLAGMVDENGNDALRNLAHLESSATLSITNHNFVTNAPFSNDGSLFVRQGATTTSFTAAVFLTNFDPATRTITGGNFSIFAPGPSSGAELRFSGADIVNMGSSITLSGPLARIADLAGNNGLRNFARILPSGLFTLSSHSFAMAGPLLNEGSLSLFGQSVFAVTGNLENFDPASRTFSGGNFDITGDSQLKFAGADIVHNAASITLSRQATITDLAGNDALRNFAVNLADGKFVVGNYHSFTASGDFTNAGHVETAPMLFQTRQILREGRFILPTGFRYVQTAGITVNNGFLIAEHVDIFGGTFTGRGTVFGDLTVQNGTYLPTGQTVIQGNLTLTPDSHFRYQLDFGNPKEVTGTVVLAGTLEVDIPSDRFIGSTRSFTILNSATPLTGVFGNAPNGARIPTADGKGSVVVYYESKRVWVWQYQAEPPPAQLLNISSRASLVASANDPSGDRAVLIGGFIITNFSANKDLVLRGLGPSLSKFGVDPVVADPVIELRSANGALLASNNDWQETQASQISMSGLAPENQREAALRITLQAGSYTVVLKEKNGLGGNGLVEIYDLSQSSTTKLANISTRGYTDASNFLIGGIITAGEGQANAEVVVRALGPQLKQNGVLNVLDDPTLEVRDTNGDLLAFNDDWGTNSDQLVWTGLTPSENQESAIRLSLPRGNYTAIVRAKGNGSGVALVEFYDLRR